MFIVITACATVAAAIGLPQSSSRATAQPARTSTGAEQACSSLPAGQYSLRLNNTVYHFRSLPPDRIYPRPVFFDAEEHQVIDSQAVNQLTIAVWVHDNILNDPDYRQGQHSRKLVSQLDTAARLKAYSTIQDALVTTSVDLIAATVSDGASAASVATKATKAAAGTSFDPSNYFLGVSAAGLARSINDYRIVESIVKQQGNGSTFDASQLLQAFDKHLEATGMENTFDPVLVSLAPQHWTDLVMQAIRSTGTEFLNVMESMPASATPAAVVDGLFKASDQLQAIQQGTNTLGQMASAAKGASTYATDLRTNFAAWSKQAHTACSTTTPAATATKVASTPKPPATTPPATVATSSANPPATTSAATHMASTTANAATKLTATTTSAQSTASIPHPASTQSTSSAAPPPAAAVTKPALAPILSSVTPTSHAVGGFYLDIYGSNFRQGAMIALGGSSWSQAVSPAFLDTSHLRAYVTITSPGTAAIVVRNPDGQSSKPAFITVSAAPVKKH